MTDVVYPYTKGGSERRIWEISKRLVEKHEIHVYCTAWGNQALKSTKIEDIQFHFINKTPKIYTEQGKRSLANSLNFAVLSLLKLLLKKFDIIDCNQSPILHCISGKITSIGKNPMVVTWHEVWGDYWNEYLGNFGYFGKMLEHTIIRLPNKIVTVSNLTKQRLISMGVDRKKISLIQNGVDIVSIQNSIKSEQEYDLVFVGRLIKNKNVNILIKAISVIQEQRPEITCVIIGDGPERTRLENLSSGLGVQDNVTFLGELDNINEIFSIMKSAKIFVSCSTMEGFGVAFLEANACSLPVIGIESPYSAVKEIIINGKNGLLCDLSIENISKKIIYLLQNEKIRRRMGNFGEKFARKYDWNNIAEKTCELYKEILS